MRRLFPALLVVAASLLGGCSALTEPDEISAIITPDPPKERVLPRPDVKVGAPGGPEGRPIPLPQQAGTG